MKRKEEYSTSGKSGAETSSVDEYSDYRSIYSLYLLFPLHTTISSLPTQQNAHY